MKKIAILACLIMLVIVAGGCNYFQSSPGTLNGKVVDLENSTAIANATVVLQGTIYQTKTDTNGNFVFSNVPAGTYTVEVTYDGYEKATQSVTITAGATTNATIQLKKINQVQLGKIIGSVKVFGSITPIAGAKVTVKDSTVTTTTDNTGNFTLDNLNYGTYTLTVSKDGYIAATKTVEVNTASVNVDFNLETVPVEKACHLTGTVVIKGTTTGIPGVLITFSGSTKTASTDANGAYAVDLPYGNYDLTATKDGFETVKTTVSLNNTTGTKDLEMVKIILPGTVESAKLFVTNFKTSMYELGNIYLGERDTVKDQYLKSVNFFQGIAPYMNELGFELIHLQVVGRMPGDYTFEGYDFNNQPIYTMTNPADVDGDTWYWNVTDSITNYTVKFSVPNVNKHLSKTDNVVNVDFTGITVFCSITNPDSPTSFDATLKVGSTNVTEYTFTVPNGPEQNVIFKVKVPTGPTAELVSTIESGDETVGNIKTTAKLDIKSLIDTQEMVLSGTVTTPVFTYTGQLSLDIEGLGTDFDVNKLLSSSYKISGSGTLANPAFKLTSDFNVHFVYVASYGFIADLANLHGQYKSVNTQFDGNVNYVFKNAKTYEFGLKPTPDNYPQQDIEFMGNLINADKTFTVDLHFSSPEFQKIALNMLIATSHFTLEGKLSLVEGEELTAIHLVNAANGLTLELNTMPTTENVIGHIFNSTTGTQLATLKLDTQLGVRCILVVYSNGDSEIVPLNPLSYLKN